MLTAIAVPIDFPVLVYPDRGVRRNLAVFGDEVRLSSMPKVKPPHFRDLDPAVFPPGDPATLALRHLQLKVSWVDGDSNGDGYLEHIYAFGGRSFSIRLPDNRLKWVSTTIRRARIGSRMACQADERTGNLSELPRSKAEIQGWFAGIALARSRIDAAA